MPASGQRPARSALGRYSFLTADPFDYFTVPADGSDGLAVLDQQLQPWTAEHRPDLPPFQGGAAGLLGYDLVAQPRTNCRRRGSTNFACPPGHRLYDVVLAFDHVAAPGLDHLARLSGNRRRAAASDRARRAARAVSRMAQRTSFCDQSATAVRVSNESSPQARAAFRCRVRRASPATSPPTATWRAVRRAIEYIHAGDIFQVNLAQRLLFPAHGDALALYLRLRQRNPATFAGYFDLGDVPDRQRLARAVPAACAMGRSKPGRSRGRAAAPPGPRPICSPATSCWQSEKDRAENVMIVDLLRNDLSRVCRPESVRVTQLCGLEIYEFVQHLVSAVRGTLRAGCDAARPAAGRVSRRLDHRGAEGAGDGDHRRAGADGPRRRTAGRSATWASTARWTRAS